MLLELRGVLDERSLATIANDLSSAHWEPGENTAHGAAKAVKHNLQLPAGSAEGKRVTAAVVESLRAQPKFFWAARPKQFARVLVARYDEGMQYGTHLDSPIMRTPTPVRVDIAFTVFLNDDYEGGELTIESKGGERSIRGSAGDAVVYPASSLHRVEPVTRGHRLVAVGWSSSLVPDPAKREILFDLTEASETLAAQHGETAAVVKLRQSLFNLLRQWAID